MGIEWKGIETMGMNQQKWETKSHGGFLSGHPPCFYKVYMGMYHGNILGTSSLVIYLCVDGKILGHLGIVMGIYSLVNCYIRSWKFTMRFLWENSSIANCKPHYQRVIKQYQTNQWKIWKNLGTSLNFGGILQVPQLRSRQLDSRSCCQ